MSNSTLLFGPSGNSPADCTCFNDTTNKECVICNTYHVNIPLSNLEKLFMLNCNIHKKVVMCGIPDFICENCKKAGWVSTAGTGGGFKLYNSLTNETKVHPMMFKF